MTFPSACRVASLSRPPIARAAIVAGDDTESSLLRRVRDAGDAFVWDEFVRRYEPLLLAYMGRRGLQEHDARDVVQDIFTRLHRALPAFRLDRQRGRFRTWLWQVASNALADWSLTRARQVRAEQGWRDRQSGANHRELSDAETPDAEHRRMLERALRLLKAQSLPKTWRCFEQRVLRRRPGTEVAEELGLTANAVNVNAARALARLRRLCTTNSKEAANDVDALHCRA